MNKLTDSGTYNGWYVQELRDKISADEKLLEQALAVFDGLSNYEREREPVVAVVALLNARLRRHD